MYYPSARLRAILFGPWMVLAGLLLPSAARANIGPQWWGDHAAEPLGLKGVAITHEELTIDLRPLAAVQPVAVEAVYYLHNPGPAQKLGLVFVTGAAGVSDFEVRLGDRPLESKPVPRVELLGNGKGWEVHPGWKPPRDPRGISGSSVYPNFAEDEKALLAFDVELPPGPSTVTARYHGRACGTHEGHPTATWVFPYILSPAKEWGSFGGLEVTVFVPEGWESASTPALEREGDVLRGSFPSLPADALMLAARAPVGPELGRAVCLYLGLYAFAAVGGGVLCWWAGRSLGRFLGRRQGVFHLWIVLAAVALAFLWAAAIFGSARLAWWGIRGSLAGQESPYFHERFLVPGCMTFLLILAVLPLGFGIAWWSARRAAAS
jgi:hypothetical protein